LDLIYLKAAMRAWAASGRRPQPGVRLPERARVLLLRHDRIGDALLSTPIVDQLARHRPGWTLDLLLADRNLHVYERHPAVARRWCYRKRPLAALGLVRALRRERYDVVVDLMNHRSHTSMVFLKLIRPGITVGFEEPGCYPFDVPVRARPKATGHIVERSGDLLRALGCPVRDEELRLSYEPSPASRRRACGFLEPLRDGGARLCGVNTSAGGPRRFWGEGNYRELLTRLGREHPGHRFVVFSDPSEVERARRIAADLPHVVLAPPGTFDELAGMVERLDSMITPDTSVAHLCAALNVPCVAMYLEPKVSRLWFPWGVEYRALYGPGDVDTIPLEEVLQAWRSLGR